ncbi:MAG: amidohydrolase family protein, partial [Gammaproteobacteria bacterium]|nr:amidohydrolase family protein [Gammaproteobacteria bacterium]
MQICDTIIYAAYIIPVIPKGQVLEQHVLIINKGKIADILPGEEARHRYQSDDIHHLNEHILIPGLINSHTHSPMNLMRGLADDLPLMTWLQEHIWPAEAKYVNPEFISDGTELAIAEMISSGTTTFNDMYFFPDVTAKLADKTGIRAVLGQILIDFPSAWAGTAKEYLDKGLSLHHQYQHHSRIYTAMAPHAPYTVSDENFKACIKQAEQLDIAIHIHVHETKDEIEQSLKNYHCRPLARLDNLGLLNEKMIAVHMTQLNEDEQQLV